MNLLLQKYNDYMRLVGCTVEYRLSNGETVAVTYKEENFPHLIGLHKLKDIRLVQFWLDRSNKSVKLKDVLRKIKNEHFTDADIKGSNFYSGIKSRYENFSYDNLTTLNYTDAVIDFDSSAINSKIKSDYILFEERPEFQYNHMGIAVDSISGRRYVETFFHEDSNRYTAGQTVVKVKGFRIFDELGAVIVEDVLKTQGRFFCLFQKRQKNRPCVFLCLSARSHFLSYSGMGMPDMRKQS